MCFSLWEALQEKLLPCFGKKSVTWLMWLCACVSACVREIAPQVKWVDSMTVSGVKLLCVFLSSLLLTLSPSFPPSLLHSHTFFSFFLSFVCATVYQFCSVFTCHFFIFHYMLFLCPLSPSPSLCPPDNDRAKECKSDGRKLPPGQDAGRTRSPFTR